MSANTITNRAWKLAKRPVGDIADGDLALVEEALPELGDGHVLVRTIYLSLDPTNRIWMSDMDQYMPPVEIGDVMRGGTLGEVIESRAEGFAPGELVQGFWGWQSHSVVTDTRMIRNKVPTDVDVPLPAWLSVLGLTGMTAYFGLLDIGQPKAGDTLVVTAAAGAVGSIAGQIGKIKGCRVVGIAGSDEKCRWLTRELGFDAAINYKTEDVGAALDTHCRKGIDVDFENVGGDILDEILARLNLKARVSLCGLISQYNSSGEWKGPTKFQNILMKRAKVEGFILTDFLPRFGEARQALGEWLAAGKLHYKVDISQGLETAPEAVKKLFDGSNTGKLMVQVGPEPG